MKNVLAMFFQADNIIWWKSCDIFEITDTPYMTYNMVEWL